VRHLFAAYDLGTDKLYGHIKKTKNRSTFLEFCRYLRSLYPADVQTSTASPPTETGASCTTRSSTTHRYTPQSATRHLSFSETTPSRRQTWLRYGESPPSLSSFAPISPTSRWQRTKAGPPP
jgi:hypothetical protein